MRMKKNVILVNGLPRAGKDTLADYLVQNYGYVKISFADELKDIICRTFNLNREDLDHYKNNEINLCIDIGDRFEEIINFRDLLRRFGTEGMKPAFGDNIWADLLYNKIKNSEHTNIVVPDFRFLCEYQLQHQELNLKTILVKDDRELPLIGHASDVELYKNNFKFDTTIINNKDESFFEKIDEIMSNFNKH